MIARLIKHKHGHLTRPRGQTKETGTMTTDQGAKRQRVGLGSLKIKRHYDQIPSVNVVIYSLSTFLKHTQWALQRQSTVGFFKLSCITGTFRFLLGNLTRGDQRLKTLILLSINDGYYLVYPHLYRYTKHFS